VRRLFLALFAFYATVGIALAEERIRNFRSEIVVQPDASIEVKETIAVVAEGFEIRRGILRDIPTSYTDRRGIRTRIGFDVVSISRNGASEPFTEEGLSNGVRIRIGSADLLLQSGLQTYEIVYRADRVLGFFEGFDELNWNVTGNGWTFPIDEASVSIVLPDGASIRQSAAYTGGQGEQSGAFVITRRDGRIFRANTTSRLNPGEGFTVAVAWQKGIVTPPTDSERAGWWLRDNAGLLSLFVGLAGVSFYYLYAWLRVGRDPEKGVIVPLFKPPDGLGPAGSRFVWRQGYDDRTFAAGLVGLAVKNRLTIKDDYGDFSITKRNEAGPALTQSEQSLLQALPPGTTALKKANHVSVGRARSRLKEALAREYEGSVFVRNIWWFVLGAILSCAVLVGSALLIPGEAGIIGLFATGWTTIWWGVILAVGWSSIKGVFASRGIFRRLTSIFPLLFLIPFMIAGVVAPGTILFGGGVNPQLVAVLLGGVVLGLMNLAFYYLLRAPTPSGRQLLDKLEGFRMYLATAEEERLKVLHPPEKTPELFERYLPYAMALDCENEWNAKFVAILAAAAAAGAAAPVWYSGSNWNYVSSGGFAENLGSALSTSVASASTAPGSSSGSGGGGSSGGGGGGGGGSGW
jgi:hypothetical protein